MKNLILILALVLINQVLLAQSPQKFNYQAVARDGLGNALSNASISVSFSILDGSATGTAIFTETQTLNTNNFGVLNTEVGKINTVQFSTINWGSGPKYLKVDISSSVFSGTLGTAQLLSVPYALYANSSSAASATDLTISGQQNGNLLYYNGNNWVPLANGSATNQVLTWTGTSLAWQNNTNSITSASGGVVKTAGNTFVLNFNPNQFDTSKTVGGVKALNIKRSFVIDSILTNANVNISRLNQIAAVPIGYILRWDGTNWTPTPDAGNVYLSGGGVIITSSNKILSAPDGLTLDTIAGKLVVKSINSSQISSLDISKLSNTGVATSGQVLKWNGSNWIARNDSVGGAASLIGKSGVTVNGSRIVANPDGISIDTVGGKLKIKDGVNDGQILKWNSVTSTWELGVDDVGTGSLPTLTVGQLVTNDGTSNVAVLPGGDLTMDATGKFTLNPKGATSGQVLKWDGSSWIPRSDSTGSSTSLIGKSGVVVDGSRIVANPDGISIDTIGGKIFVKAVSSSQINSLDAAKLTNAGAVTSGQVLKWNGSNWIARNDSVGGSASLMGKSGVTVNGSRIVANPDGISIDTVGGKLKIKDGVNDGQILKWNSVTSTWELGVDDVGTGSLPTLTVGQLVTNDGTSNVAVLPGGDLTMDATGKFTLNSKGATSGQVLKWDGSSWIPRSDSIGSSTILIGKSGVVVDGSRIVANPDGISIDTIGGKIFVKAVSSSQINSLDVAKLGNAGVVTSGQVLKWNGSNWIARNDSVGGAASLIGKSGVVVNGSRIVANPDGISIDTVGGQIFVKAVSSSQINSLDVAKLSNAGVVTSGQVLKWNGSNWIARNDSVGASANLIGKSGIVVNGNRLVANPDGFSIDTVGGKLKLINGNQSGQVLRWNGTNWVLKSDSVGVYKSGTGISFANGYVSADSNQAIWNAEKIISHGIDSSKIANGRILKYNASNKKFEFANDSIFNGGTLQAFSYYCTFCNSLQFNNKIVDSDNTYNTTSNRFKAKEDGLYFFSSTITVSGPNGATFYLNRNSNQVVPASSGGLNTGNNSFNLSAILSLVKDDEVYMSGNAGNVQDAIFSGYKLASSAASAGAGDNWGGQTVVSDVSVFSGDGSSTALSILDNGITSNKVANLNTSKLINTNAVTSGQVLKWNGSNWIARNDSVGGAASLIGKSGVIVNGSRIVANPDGISIDTIGGKIFVKAVSSSQINSLDVAKLSNAGAVTSGQVLKWNGSNWIARNDSVAGAASLIGKSGVTVNGSRIVANPDGISIDTIGGKIFVKAVSSSQINSLDVAKLSNAGAVTSGQVLKWNGSNWIARNDSVGAAASLIGKSGVIVNGSRIVANPDGISIDTIGGKIFVKAVSSSQINSLDVAKLTNAGAVASGQVLKWNGSNWIARNDSVGSGVASYVPGAGININGSYINADSSAPIWNANRINDIGVESGTPGLNAILKFDGANWIFANDDVGGGGLPTLGAAQIITNDGTTNVAVPVSGALAMDASGVFSIQRQGATSGQVLKWNGSNWIARNDSVGAAASLIGKSGVIVNGSRIVANPDGISIDTIGGKIFVKAVSSSQINSLDVAKLSNAGAVTSGQVLKWNGSNWIARNDSVGGAASLIGKSGVIVNGSRIVANPDGISIDTIGGKIFVKAVSSSQINSLDVAKLSNAGAVTSGQVLKWNGSNWIARNDSVAGAASLIGKSGVTVNGSRIVANPDGISIDTIGGKIFVKAVSSSQINSLDVAKLSNAGAVTSGQVLKWNGSNWIARNDSVGAAASLIGKSGVIVNGSRIVANPDGISIDTIGGKIFVKAVSSSQINSLDVAKLTNAGAVASGQVLKWNGSNWIARNDSVGSGVASYVPGAGININGSYINADSSAPIWNANRINDIGVESGTPGLNAILKFDGANWIFANDDVGGGGLPTLGAAQIITNDGTTNVAVPVSGALAMDASGVFSIQRQGATSGQVLKWNGSNWIARNDSVGAAASLIGKSGVIVNGSRIVANPDGISIDTIGGKIFVKAVSSSQINSLDVAKLSNAGAVTSGQVLKWNGSNWIARNDSVGAAASLIGKSGVIVNGSRIVANPDGISIDTIGGKIFVKAVSSSQINSLDVAKLSNAGAVTSGQVLKWNGSNWIARNDSVGAAASLIGKSGVIVNGSRIVANPDGITIDTVGGKIFVANLGISTTKLIDNSVTAIKLAPNAVDSTKIRSGGNNKVLTTTGAGTINWADKASLGKTYTAGSGILVNAGNQVRTRVDSITIETSSNILQVKDAGITAIKLAPNAVDSTKIRSGGNNKVLTTSGAGTINWADKASLGKTYTAGSGILVNAGNQVRTRVDSVTIETSANILQVKDAGITAIKLAPNAVDSTKIRSGGNNKVLTTTGTGTVNWVDKKSLIFNPTITNGITKVTSPGDTLKLGGALTQNTTITTGTKTLQVAGDFSGGGQMVANQSFPGVISNASNTDVVVAKTMIYIPAGTLKLSGSILAHVNGGINGSVGFRFNAVITKINTVSSTTPSSNLVEITGTIPSGWQLLEIVSNRGSANNVVISGYNLTVKNN